VAHPADTKGPDGCAPDDMFKRLGSLKVNPPAST